MVWTLRLEMPWGLVCCPSYSHHPRKWIAALSWHGFQKIWRRTGPGRSRPVGNDPRCLRKDAKERRHRLSRSESPPGTAGIVLSVSRNQPGFRTAGQVLWRDCPGVQDANSWSHAHAYLHWERRVRVCVSGGARDPVPGVRYRLPGCRSPSRDRVGEKISKALPETVFVYVSPKRRPKGGWTPPMVLDHGKALLFIEPAGQDEDAPRPMVLGGSDGAAGHEDSDQGAAS